MWSGVTALVLVRAEIFFKSLGNRMETKNWPHAIPKFAYCFQKYLRSHLMQQASEIVWKHKTDRTQDQNLHTVFKTTCGHTLWSKPRKSHVNTKLAARTTKTCILFSKRCAVTPYETSNGNRMEKQNWPHARLKFAYCFQNYLRSHLMKQASEIVCKHNIGRTHCQNVHTN